MTNECRSPYCECETGKCSTGWGDARGYCLQITSDHGYVQLTREAAACLAADIFRYFLKTPEPAGNAEYPQAAEVCAELYQVIGSLASDLGVFDHPKVVKALDNASQHSLVHDDVLPFPSFESTEENT